jgi:two-component system, cell cycle response regulator
MPTNTSILVVSDTPANFHFIKGLLPRQGCKVWAVRNGIAALSLAQMDPPDLILMDPDLPGLNGLDACRKLKEDERLRLVPVIFLYSTDNPADRERGFEAGGADYLTLPLRPSETLARINTHISLYRLKQNLAEKNAQLEIAIAEQKRAEDEIEWLANTDPLTGLNNRSHFLARAEIEFLRALRYNRPLSVVIFSPDHFTEINTAYGYDVCDQVLVYIARLLRSSARDLDVVARWGDDEFILLLPETDRLAAAHAAERLRLRVEETPFPLDLQAETMPSLISLTISAGITGLDSYMASSGREGGASPSAGTASHAEHFSQILQHAQKALSQARQTGYNHVVMYEKTKAEIA